MDVASLQLSEKKLNSVTNQLDLGESPRYISLSIAYTINYLFAGHFIKSIHCLSLFSLAKQDKTLELCCLSARLECSA